MVLFPKPSNAILHQYIVESNSIEGTPVSHADIETTLARKQIHPHVAGHLSALNYAIEKLAKNPNWPAHHPTQFANPKDADTNLYWLRELHRKMATPVAQCNETIHTLDHISLADCGRYRLHPHCLGLDRWQPKADKIPALLFHWYKNLGTFHLKWKDKLQNLKLDEVRNLNDAAAKFHDQLQCIHAFAGCSGRHARMVENALRLRWGLPWKITYANQSVSYVQKIAQYEDSPDWQQHLKTLNAKEGQ